MATEPAPAVEDEEAEEQPAPRPAGLDLNMRPDEEEEPAVDGAEASPAVAAGTRADTCSLHLDQVRSPELA